jgi:hypothetical protein
MTAEMSDELPGNETPPTVRLFKSHEQARGAVLALTSAGIDPEAVSIIARSDDEVATLHEETGADQKLESSVKHNRFREVLDILGSLEALLVPGFGGVLVTGDLVPHIDAVLSDIRDEDGAITAALVRLGVAPDEAGALERAVGEGQTLLVVHGSYDVASARAALQLNTEGTTPQP